jgi:hypothetical protein
VILFDLRCAQGHEFEAWFRDWAAYDEQAAAGAIACAVCGSTSVSKALMAPAVATGGARPDPQRAAEAMRTLRKVQDHIEKNFDHVGPGFAEEARKMHYGETDRRSIYGEATRTEAKELRDEGIQFGQVPWLPRQDG